MTAVALHPLPAGQPALLRALRRLLQPLIRLLVAEGITYPYFAEFLKGLFVEAAEAEIRSTRGRATDSRLSLLSGVHRKDVRRLTREQQSDTPPPRTHGIGITLVARWLSDPAFLDDDGKPIALSRTPGRGSARSFAELAESISADIRPRTMLDELLRLGIVRVDEDDVVHLETQGFVPSKERDAKAIYFGDAIHDHVAAGAHNLQGGQPPFLERSVCYDELSPAAIERLAARSEPLAMAMLTEINREADAEEKRDPPAPAQRMRMRLGVYFYAAPVAPPQPAMRLVANGGSAP